jgi:hypothetical protein
MATSEMTMNEIRTRGYAALARELGPVGYVRFIQQFSVGAGDYTVERREFADSTTPEQLRQLIQQQRERK